MTGDELAKELREEAGTLRDIYRFDEEADLMIKAADAITALQGEVEEAALQADRMADSFEKLAARGGRKTIWNKTLAANFRQFAEVIRARALNSTAGG